ncbi:hypothetical protein LTR14_012251, partial [Exophiala xenobiotica]
MNDGGIKAENCLLQSNQDENDSQGLLRSVFVTSRQTHSCANFTDFKDPTIFEGRTYGGRFRIVEKLDYGYRGVDLKSHQSCMVHVAAKGSDEAGKLHAAEPFYQVLKDVMVAPKSHLFQTEDNHVVQVLDWVGPSVAETLRRCYQVYQREMSLLLIRELLRSLWILHRMDIVHGDLQPTTIRWNGSQICFVGFHNARDYHECKQEYKHRMFSGLRGSVRYASYQAHRRVTSACDDIWAGIVSCRDIPHGLLHWDNLGDCTKVKNQKLVWGIHDLAYGCPKAFEYALMVISSGRYQRPDYGLLDKLFDDAYQESRSQPRREFEWLLFETPYLNFSQQQGEPRWSEESSQGRTAEGTSWDGDVQLGDIRKTNF